MNRLIVNALVTPQWRSSWEEIVWDSSVSNGVPQKAFLTFVMSAAELRKFSGVFRRTPRADEGRSEDDNIQRPHESARSREIRRFVEHGYPMSNMTQSQLAKADVSMQRPGWLPTAVVVNILTAGETREGLSPLTSAQSIIVPALEDVEGGDVLQLRFPSLPGNTVTNQTPPLEVIDGQHRLWAFEDEDRTDDYFLPVVAFLNLSKAHQAYLFWSINIKPKKINTSLAFDLYPILRSQEWLMQGEGLKIYRESRAQELTEALWASPKSPWYDRINMIGARGVSKTKPVSQASFVRSLLASFVKSWSSTRSIAGGLFGTDEEGGLDWNRSQQAAFLVAAWQELLFAIERSEAAWARELREADADGKVDPLGRYSMLGSDQGVRAFLMIVNELAYRLRDDAKLRAWQMPPVGEAIDSKQVDEALEILNKTTIRGLLREISTPLAEFDWRTTKAPGVSDESARMKSMYRGSSGYVALRKDLYRLLTQSSSQSISEHSLSILQELEGQDGSID